MSIFQPFVNLGGFIAAVISNIFSENLRKSSYQLQLCILYAVPLWLAISVWFLPESPRWLMIKRREREAKDALVRLRPGSVTSEAIACELAEISDSLKAERQMASEVIWSDIWRGRDLVSRLSALNIVYNVWTDIL